MEEEENQKIYVFDEEDLMLFKMKDLPLKGRAIQHYILPKLEKILLDSVSAVNNIYDIDIFKEYSTTAFSPNFREKRKTDNFVDWQFAKYSITGVGKPIWKGVVKKGEKIIPCMPFYLSYYLFKEEVTLEITLDNFNQKNNLYYKYYEFIRDNFPVIRRLLEHANMEFVIDGNDDDSIFRPYEDILDEIIKTKKYDEYNVYIRRGYEPPIDDDQIEELINSFIKIYPIYDSLIQISLGEEHRFYELLEIYETQLEELISEEYEIELNDEGEEIGIDDDNEIPEEYLEKIGELVDKFEPRDRMRWNVLDRDNFRCVACGRSSHEGAVLHVDHIIPRSKGGKDEFDNYQTLCRSCNLGKSNKSVKDLRKKK